ncbi:MAG: amidohydrolase family protein [Solirubrobacterales bacterium]|nr:amidohydrolase family protein [Solirubrobacterales bacterium]
MGAASDADRGALPDRRHHASGRVDHRRAGAKRRDRDPRRPRPQARGGDGAIRVVDAHVHVIVPELLRCRRHDDEWRPRVRRDAGEQLVELDGREIRSAVNEFVDVPTILAIQARAGVDAVVLCPWVPLLFPEVEPAACLERCRIQNQALAGLARDNPERVAALGAVPLQDPELAAAELRELRRDGALAGVEVTASVGGVYVGEPRFEPFWAAAAETEALVFIHPTTRGFDAPVFGEHYLWNTVGNPLETTIAAAQLVMGGVMERHPRLRVLLAHGGGAVLALRGRLRHSHTFQPQARAELTESPLASIRRFHFDTITHDRELLAALIEFAGAERVLLGSDYPFDMADHDPVASVRALDLPEAAQEAVLGGNAARLTRGSAVHA